MSDEVINANPTIINVESLPTRLGAYESAQTAVKSKLLDTFTSLSLFQTENLSSPELTGESSDNWSDDDEPEEEIDAQEIFDLIGSISDPEHPLTLAQLAVVNFADIHVKNGPDKHKDLSEVLIKITPTITHCSLATLIGLGIRVRLERCLPPRFRIRILVKEGTHESENQVNKQLNDKERVAAACENEQLLTVISQMLGSCK
ncbi:hypothetical protein PSN45_003539 [Yamadazyma tenuis]|uniref:Uncharacterized protein n=1 Tax=Candida tenuis (strain ATCC 10573 / BCRC 21748 / CBS 615 / JCM 9827 / NBRC 10315 / NRRL Y-1498 / VKM Y-70) TaxID=590646 RepID=G3AXS1_CANTC|nr:uncharacterized protein CANTEDRAFT_112549 [Yamadazyma tenuis ATCC 10573]EGV65680.1 hypothetical protein CANTEDRAFT_112549 [Yamadazyma tenuis ATCC 10573]WEJ96005.1 hypothetical protein PSN45_003539 [Yamadazyma tenuis]